MKRRPSKAGKRLTVRSCRGDGKSTDILSTAAASSLKTTSVYKPDLTDDLYDLDSLPPPPPPLAESQATSITNSSTSNIALTVQAFQSPHCSDPLLSQPTHQLQAHEQNPLIFLLNEQEVQVGDHFMLNNHINLRSHLKKTQPCSPPHRIQRQQHQFRQLRNILEEDEEQRGPKSTKAGKSVDQGNGGKPPSNPIPRYKRPAHIDAEYRRRGKIQRGLDMMQNLVPALQISTNVKQSKAAVLTKSMEYIREQAADCERQKVELEALQKEIDDLQQDLQLYQQQLPSCGVTAVERPSCYAERMIEEYLQSSIAEDWKFWIFSFIVRPLSESFLHCVTLASKEDFLQSVQDWSDQHMTLVNLRPVALTLLRTVSTTTSIITEPEKLEEEVNAMMNFDVKPIPQSICAIGCDQQSNQDTV